jgi:hypothetical protein
MDGLYEVRVTRERWEGRRFISLEEVAKVTLWGIERGEVLPGHLLLRVTPDPLHGVQCRAIGEWHEVSL